MADIVGLIASVLQLVSTVAQARSYIKDFRHASQDQLSLLLEIESLETLVKKVAEQINRSGQGGLSTGLRQFEKPLIQLEGMMKRLTNNLTSKGISSRLTWPLWGKEDVKDGLDTIERFKSLLDVWLGMDIRDSTQDIGLAVKDLGEEQRTNHGYMVHSISHLGRDQKEYHEQTISSLKNGNEERRLAEGCKILFTRTTYYLMTMGVDIFKNTRDLVRNQEYDRDAGMRDKIIGWYSPLNFFPRQSHILSTRQPGTGQWLLDDTKFRAWKSGTGNILWCHGMPGAGKTVLVSTVVDYLQGGEDCDIGVAVVYLSHKETDDQSPSMLLAGLWRQLVFGKPISSNLRDLYTKHHENAPGHPWMMTTLYFVPQSLVTPKYFFWSMRWMNILRGIRVLYSSVLDDIIPNTETLEIRAKEDDIRRYIRAQISPPSRLSKHVTRRPSLQEEIETAITQRSDGMFLLAKFHIDFLSEMNTIKAVREALNNLPGDLPTMYNDIGYRINRQIESDKKLAWIILAWISNAKRPLQSSELVEALAVEPETTALDPDNVLDMPTILSVCAGLVIVNEEDNIIRLVHYTTQGYLERIQDREFPNVATEITRTCITYLSFDIFVQATFTWDNKPENYFKQHVFLDYAVQYALAHARGRPESNIKPLILSFLTSNFAWRRLWDNRRPGTTGNFLPESASPLWTAAWFHLKEFCRQIIQEEGTGIVLEEAVGYGNNDALRNLLEAGADVHATTEGNGTAMHFALKLNSYELFKVLVEHGADVNTRGGPYGTALHTLSILSYEDARFCLEHGANVDAVGADGHTALHLALNKGNEKMSRLLIEHGAVLDAKQYENTLRHVSRLGYIGCVRILLEHGVDVNAPSTYSDEPGYPYHHVGCTALHMAALNSFDNSEVVRLLLAHGADVKAVSAKHGTPLMAVSGISGWDDHAQETIRLLIEHGAEVDAVGGSWPSDLHIFLNDGAHDNPQDEPWGTALVMAAYEEKVETVRLLIKHGANVNARVGDCMTALAAASWKAHGEKVVQLLIEHGADVNAEAESWGSALCAAVNYKNSLIDGGHIVRLLLQHGANPNGLGTRQWTILGLAAQSGWESVVRQLLQHGAEVNAKSRAGNMALHAAILRKGRSSDVAELLIENGADINADGGEYGTPLQIALGVPEASRTIVEMLIKNGAEIDSKSATILEEFKAGTRTWGVYHIVPTIAGALAAPAEDAPGPPGITSKNLSEIIRNYFHNVGFARLCETIFMAQKFHEF
ncbi:ankyrin repeat-containing domain protein [Mycena olivaceomarginata]|nr:ankyrin repeat-containing domain protein [Mycena olivaceomarginata]